MIKLVHVLILIIVAFMLYYLSRCNDYNGFSVGSQEVDNCSRWNGSWAVRRRKRRSVTRSFARTHTRFINVFCVPNKFVRSLSMMV